MGGFPVTYPLPLPTDDATSGGGGSGLILTAEPKVSNLSVRGIRFANVQGGRADMVVHGGPRVWHVNSLQTVQNLPAQIQQDGQYSGVIKFRFRSYKSFPIPDSINTQ